MFTQVQLVKFLDSKLEVKTLFSAHIALAWDDLFPLTWVDCGPASAPQIALKGSEKGLSWADVRD